MAGMKLDAPTGRNILEAARRLKDASQEELELWVKHDPDIFRHVAGVLFADRSHAPTTQSGDEWAAAEAAAEEIARSMGTRLWYAPGEAVEGIAAIITKHMPRALPAAAVVTSEERAAFERPCPKCGWFIRDDKAPLAFYCPGCSRQLPDGFYAKHTSGPGGVSVVLSVAEDAVIEERRRQVIKEGWTAAHDDEHVGGEMARAAGCYALWAGGMHELQRKPTDSTEWCLPSHWPWSRDWWKPKNARHDLVRAAALIIAEIERLDRLQGSPS